MIAHIIAIFGAVLGFLVADHISPSFGVMVGFIAGLAAHEAHERWGSK